MKIQVSPGEEDFLDTVNHFYFDWNEEFESMCLKMCKITLQALNTQGKREMRQPHLKGEEFEQSSANSTYFICLSTLRPIFNSHLHGRTPGRT